MNKKEKNLVLKFSKYSTKQRAAIEMAIVSIYCGLVQNCTILHWCMCGHLKHDQSRWQLVADMIMAISFIALIISTPSYLPKTVKTIRRYLVLIVAASPILFAIQMHSNVKISFLQSASRFFTIACSAASIIASIVLMGLSCRLLFNALKLNPNVDECQISINDGPGMTRPRLSTFSKAAFAISIAANIWLVNDLIGKTRRIKYLSIQAEAEKHLLSDSMEIFDTAIGLKAIESIRDAQRLWGPPEQIRFYHEYETYETPYEKCNDGIELKYGDIRALFDCNKKLLKIREWTGTGWMTLKSSTI